MATSAVRRSSRLAAASPLQSVLQKEHIRSASLSGRLRTSTTANCEPHARVKRGRVPRKRQNTQGGGDDEETPVHVDMEEDAVVAVQTVDTQSRRARVPKSLPGRSIEEWMRLGGVLLLDL